MFRGRQTSVYCLTKADDDMHSALFQGSDLKQMQIDPCGIPLSRLTVQKRGHLAIGPELRLPAVAPLEAGDTMVLGAVASRCMGGTRCFLLPGTIHFICPDLAQVRVCVSA